MNKNVGGIDRSVRIILGLAVIGAGVFYSSWWGAVGAVPLLTGLMSWCPPYALFGMNTCSIKKD